MLATWKNTRFLQDSFPIVKYFKGYQPGGGVELGVSSVGIVTGTVWEIEKNTMTSL